MTKTLERINFDNIGAPTRYADDIYTLKACMTVAKWQQFGQKCVFPLTSGNLALPLRASPVRFLSLAAPRGATKAGSIVAKLLTTTRTKGAIMSRRSSLMSRAILAVVATAVSVGYANAQQFQAVFSGLNEVPPVVSQGQGTLKMTLSGASLSYTLIFTNLSSTAAAAHIQFARARDNGGVIVFLCGGGGKPACPSSLSGTVSGTITAADVIGTPVQGLSAGDFTTFATLLASQATYGNIHTAQFPAGEIRGEVLPCPPNGCP
jgi:CHRD domain